MDDAAKAERQRELPHQEIAGRHVGRGVVEHDASGGEGDVDSCMAPPIVLLIAAHALPPLLFLLPLAPLLSLPPSPLVESLCRANCQVLSPLLEGARERARAPREADEGGGPRLKSEEAGSC
jgi:hypothetical protein